MYINCVDYQKIASTDLSGLVMQDHFKRYFIDLYGSYKMLSEINDMTLVYRYEDTAAYLFDNDRNQLLCSQSDYLFFPSWGMIVDSNSAAPELYLKNKYKWTASILDIRDCGSLCVYYALHLMLKMINHLSLSAVSCMTVENVFPASDAFRDKTFPEINYAALISFSSVKKNVNDARVLYSDIYQNRTHFSYLDRIMETITQIAKRYNIDTNKYHTIARQIVDKKNIYLSLDLIPHPVSSGFLYYILDQIKKTSIKIDVKYVFVVDIDWMANCFGVLLIEMGENDVNSIAQ